MLGRRGVEKSNNLTGVLGARKGRILVSVALVTVALLGSYLGASWWGYFVPEEAKQAAVAQYGKTSGLSGLSASDAIGWDDCAVVELSDHSGAGARVIMLKVASVGWRLARVAGPGVSFDFDDLHAGHAECLRIAQSSGPVTNGVPGEG